MGTTVRGNKQLKASGVSAGEYGDATHVPVITVNAQGQIEAASEVAISGGGGGSITVEEVGGGLSVPDVTVIKVTDNHLVDDGGGEVSINLATNVQQDGSDEGSSDTINFVPGAGITITVTQGDPDDPVEVEIAAAGGGGFPVHATLWHDESVATVGAALAHAIDLAQFYSVMTYNGTPTNGDTFEQEFFIAAGTYTLFVLGETFNSAGRIDWYLDAEGSPQIALQDWYSGGAVYNVVKSGAITITGDGVHTLRGVVNGKNGSSSSFYVQFTKMWIR